MSLSVAAFYALVLIGTLFAVATFVETRQPAAAANPRVRHTAYTLALGVYCSSWTFYGAVGSAVRDGWAYLPIYLAPVLLLVLAPRFLRRLSEAVRDEKATTISDFIAARFGHDPGVARLVTLIALAGTVPYVALQLRSIGGAVSVVSGRDVAVPVMVAASAAFALFAILFGARRYEAAGRSEGMLFSIALESVVKLGALVLVGAMAISVVARAEPARLQAGIAALAERFSPGGLTLEILVIGLVSAMAVIVLPRQFFMGLAEAQEIDDLPRARLGLAAYIGAMALLVVPIALAGMIALPPGEVPDLFVLQLPAAQGNTFLVVAALLGGMSSGAAMVIVDATALAIMVSNDLIFPAVLRNDAGIGPGIRAGDEAGRLGRRMMIVRRLAILGIVALALAWALLLPQRSSLASIGLVAFAAMAQFTPHLLLGVAARGRNPRAARASLSAGFALWLYTLALPPIVPERWMAALSGTLADPVRLFGIGDASPVVHGVAWSLAANLLVLAAGIAGASPHRPLPGILPGAVRSQPPVRTVGDLGGFVARFVGEERTAEAFADLRPSAPVDRSAARRARSLIAGVVGASSARALVASALASGQLNIDEVTRLLDEGGQSLRFSRQLLAATFENIDAGISVVDSDLNLVAWNTRYIELFDYPPEMVRVGAPIADLIRFNVRRGDFPHGDAERHVDKRIRHLRRRQPYSSERQRADGRVIKSIGGPMPGGGYVTSFTDITEEARVRAELRCTLEELETRVAERTHELSEANRRLAAATREKTRFLAAASHDLLQPLHAARLFASALDRTVEPPAKALVGRVERSILAAEDLLRALLDISRLDAGGVQPNLEAVVLGPLVRDIAEGLRPLAEEKGLRLRVGPVQGTVLTDPGLLRSVLQNLLSNAVRYTERGGILIGVRRRGAMLRIDVVDTGVGIPEGRRQEIFSEFTRLGQVEAEGLGLGLAIVERISRLLDVRVEMASREGRGSRFSVVLRSVNVAAASPEAARGTAASHVPLSVLVVDNDPAIIDATMALLESMGHAATGVATTADALAHAGTVDAALVDYHLDHGESGLVLADRLRQTRPSLPVAMITAESGAYLCGETQRRGIALLAKPADPAEIEAFLAAAPTARDPSPAHAEPSGEIG